MFFKLTHEKQVHIYNPKDNPSLIGLKAYVQTAFKSLPDTFQFSYLDDQNDQITLSNEEDFKIMRQISNRVVKIFIKKAQFEFFDHTAQVKLDDEIQKLAEQVSSKNAEEKEEFVNIVDEPKVSEKQEIIEEKKDVIKIVQSQIQNKFKKLMPQMIEKVKEELTKQSGPVKSEVKSQIQVEKPKIIHQVTCNECGINNFERARYKCPVCIQYNICQECEKTSEHPHPFLKIKHPKQAKIGIRDNYDDHHHNFFGSNERKGRFERIPFVKDIKNFAQGFFGYGKYPLIREGFQGLKKEYPQKNNFPQFSEQKLSNQMEKKPEQKKEQIAEELKQQRIMRNASYIQEILGICYTKCYKFSQKHPTLTQEQLLELYFVDTKQLV